MIGEDVEFMAVYVYRVTFAGQREQEARIPCPLWHRLIGKQWHGWFDLDEYKPQPQRGSQR